MTDNQSQEKSKIQQLTQKLIDQGKDEEFLVQFLAEVDGMASAKLFAEAMVAVFDKDDIARINDEAENQEQANQMINKLFAEKTGQDPVAIKEQIIEDLADDFLKNLEK